MTMTASQLHEAIELGDEFLVGSSGEKLDYCKSLEDELRGEIGAVKARHKTPRAYQPGISALKRELQHCAESYDELHADYEDATGRQYPRYDDPRVIDVSGETIGAYIRLPNGGYKRMTAEQAAKYAILSPAAKLAYQKKVAPSCADTVGARPSGYRYVRTPAGTTLRMSTRLIAEWKRLTPAQQRSLLWRATRNRGTTARRELPCL